jgi:hypothetical protein
VKNYIKETRYLHKFTVRVGTIASVLDMLRYDNCFPANEDESRKLMKLMGTGGKPTREDHVVTFLSAKRTIQGPTIERWESFGCEVVKVFTVRDGQFAE